MEKLDPEVIERMEAVYTKFTEAVESAAELTMSLSISRELSIFFSKPKQAIGAIHSNSSFTVTIENMVHGILSYIAFMYCSAPDS